MPDGGVNVFRPTENMRVGPPFGIQCGLGLKAMTRFQRHGLFARFKHPGGIRAAENRLAVAHLNPVAFRQTNHCQFRRDHQQFANMLLAGLALMTLRQGLVK